MKDDIVIKIETWHKPDMGALENVHQLDEETLKDVEVVSLDIANKDEEAPGDYKPEEEPALLQSTKTGRGPLSPEWKDELRSECPQMCTYKLVTVQDVTLWPSASPLNCLAWLTGANSPVQILPTSFTQNHEGP